MIDILKFFNNIQKKSNGYKQTHVVAHPLDHTALLERKRKSIIKKRMASLTVAFGATFMLFGSFANDISIEHDENLYAQQDYYQNHAIDINEKATNYLTYLESENETDLEERTTASISSKNRSQFLQDVSHYFVSLDKEHFDLETHVQFKKQVEAMNGYVMDYATPISESVNYLSFSIAPTDFDYSENLYSTEKMAAPRMLLNSYEQDFEKYKLLIEDGLATKDSEKVANALTDSIKDMDQLVHYSENGMPEISDYTTKAIKRHNALAKEAREQLGIQTLYGTTTKISPKNPLKE